MATDYVLHVVRVQDVVWKRKLFNSTKPDLYVSVKLGETVLRTSTIKRNTEPAWDDFLKLSSPEVSSTIHVQLNHESSLGNDRCVGSIDIEFSSLLQHCANGEVTRLFLNAPSRGASSTKRTGTLHVSLVATNAMTSARGHILAAAHAIQQGGITGSAAAVDSTTVAIVDAGGNLLSQGDDLYRSVGNLLVKLDAFADVMDDLSEAHPYLKLAWEVTSGMYKVVSNQFKYDKKVIDLFHCMAETFNFVYETESFRYKTQSLQKVIVRLLQQTTECCLFVQHYARRSFTKRLLDIGSKAKVDAFEQSFAALKQSLDSGVASSVAFVSSRMASVVDDLFLSSRLQPDVMDAFHRPRCLPGTRTEILAQIEQHLPSDDDQNILWLSGVAGSGKSTISTTIAEHFHGISRLGAFLFFQRGKSEPSSVIRTIAYKLASFDSSIGQYVVDAIRQDNAIVSAPASKQFEKLLFEPLTAAADAMQGPVIIILDALDECGDVQSRRVLMQLIRQEFPKLPKNFRFLITSRKESDIDKALSSRPDSVQEIQLDSDSRRSKSDVLTFLSSKMDEIVRVREEVPIPPTWPWMVNMARLGKAAGGLFIWASTAVKLVDDSDDPFRKLDELVQCTRLPNGFDLSRLYSSVLLNSGIDWSDRISICRFQQVLSLILFSKRPLTIADIDGVLGFDLTSPSVQILSRLQSVLVYSAGSSVRLLHASFSDYLLAPERSDDSWYIDIPVQQSMVAERCFTVMSNLLRFNICGVESSYIPNDSIVGLADRIQQHIPSHLTYACLFWAHHLLETSFSSTLLEHLLGFLCKRLFYWLEVLSFIKKVNRAYPALSDAVKWIATNDLEISELLKDARMTITRFAECFALSASHIYISMLPFMSKESRLSIHYLRCASSLVQLNRRGKQRQPLLLKEIKGHARGVESVSFSPDGTRIASGSFDQTIRVWDVQTGELVSGPFEGHAEGVTSVVFSSDGARIASGSHDKTICVWDAQTGELVSGPFEGHKEGVSSVTFSPDGDHIASGSHDKTICVWDAHTGGLVSGPFEGHSKSVLSVAFSPDGARIASGSRDRKIRVWDALTGGLISGPFGYHADDVRSIAYSSDGTRIVSGSDDQKINIWDAQTGLSASVPPLAFEGHKDCVLSVAFSPDGARIVSGSDDRTIRIWDVQTRKLVSGPFEGHAEHVSSVAFSPDGTCIASGSDDRTICLWDAQTYRLASRPVEGHAWGVTSVAFSLDGAYIASGSDDRTIRIWDVQTGKLVSRPFKGHAWGVTSVVFSPDGTCIASGSYDKTIRVWDAQTGELVSGPFEGHVSGVRSVVFSPDGARIASGSDDKTIYVWDAQTGELVSGPFEGHRWGVSCVAFSPDGARITSGSYDKTIRIWDVQTGKLVSGPFKGHAWGVLSVAFSPDGARIASGSHDKTICVWDVQTGELVSGPFEGHIAGVRSIAFSPDGARIASGSDDMTIRVWDAYTGALVSGPFEGHAKGVSSVVFSPDGARIASASDDKTIRIIDTKTSFSKAWEGATPKTSSISNWRLTEDGWVVGRQNELLLWVPPELRVTLWRPQTVSILSCEFSTRLDFTRAALGERWQECYNAT